MKTSRFLAISAALAFTVPLSHAAEGGKSLRATAAKVDAARIRQAEPGNWLTHGRTYSEQRYSPLKQIHSGNVGKLGLAWHYDTHTSRGIEATPLAVDGVLYATGPWSVVYALDGRTGKLLWEYDPQVPKAWGKHACCDAVNRGPAAWKGKVYVGTLDGRLVALNAATGKPVWDVLTIDRSRPYTITGAPRVVKGKVIIGNGGAEFGVRGYVSAYDAETGKLAWRFYTVPGDPSQPFENAALARAATTWGGGEWWKIGGGGTVWDSIAYDPELDLLYIGVGNGSPWSRQIRSPSGGDNLYLSSILALRPDNGDLIWHYQTTPGDNWDYTATQHMILADLEINGRMRKTLLQAPKNGFFYVLDRGTGELISAEKYVKVTWAERVDIKSGRPVETANARYESGPQVAFPSAFGGHNWQPMSFNPGTGLVYIPANEIPGLYAQDPNFKYQPGGWNTGTTMMETLKAVPPEVVSGHLSAWDPVKQKEAWRVQYKGPSNGGTMTTAGNLVFQGTADGRFVAYAADTGNKLWESPAQTGVVAAPITYTIGGEQYVTVMAGWGGAYALIMGEAAAANKVRHVGRILTFKLGATGQLPPLAAVKPFPKPIPVSASPEVVQKGENLYLHNCVKCHGAGVVSGGVLPDLRHSEPAMFGAYQDIVLRGALEPKGMPHLGEHLSAEDVEAIKTFVLTKAWEDYEKRNQPEKRP